MGTYTLAPTPVDMETYLSTKEAADYMRVTPQTLNMWRHTKVGPPCYKAGVGKNARILYKKIELDDWIEKGRCQ